MGSGKTTLLSEASDLLTARRIAHGAIDVDALGICHLPRAASTDLAYRNLASIWQNYAAAGVSRLLVAEALESSGELNRIRDAVPGAELVVCRLTAPLETMRRRVLQREPGMLRDTFVARVGELEALIDKASLQDFTLANDDHRSITDVAVQMLRLATWID